MSRQPDVPAPQTEFPIQFVGRSRDLIEECHGNWPNSCELTHDAENERACDHEGNLDSVGPDDCSEPAEDSEDGSDQEQHDSSEV